MDDVPGGLSGVLPLRRAMSALGAEGGAVGGVARGRPFVALALEYAAGAVGRGFSDGVGRAFDVDFTVPDLV